jgi:hypothetical protein
MRGVWELNSSAVSLLYQFVGSVTDGGAQRLPASNMARALRSPFNLMSEDRLQLLAKFVRIQQIRFGTLQGDPKTPALSVQKSKRRP